MVGEDYRSQAALTLKKYWRMKVATEDAGANFEKLQREGEEKDAQIRGLGAALRRSEFENEDKLGRIMQLDSKVSEQTE